MVKITGMKAHSSRLKRMASSETRREVGKAVYVAADIIRTEAALSITQGSVSGKEHVPSAPGEPPNRDTGHLDSNIIAVKTGELTAEVQSNAETSAPLEFGTSRMEPRPFMKPAADKHRPTAQALVQKAVRKATRG